METAPAESERTCLLDLSVVTTKNTPPAKLIPRDMPLWPLKPRPLPLFQVARR